MQARTVPLPKVPEAPSSDQVRPITILAQLYRSWSRLISAQLIDHFSSCLPAWLTGFLRQRGPMDACYVQSMLVEQSIAHGTHATGFSIDLIKCFNTMCRNSVLAILEPMKVPGFVLQMWSASLDRLQRFWVLGSECSDLVPASTGCPEGDTLSGIAMLGMAYAWLLKLHHEVPAAMGWAYADNWSWAIGFVDDHYPILQLTTKFITATKMQLDWSKAWSWSTEPGHRTAIDNIVGKFQTKTRVQHCQSAMDLGCQFNYRGVPVLGGLRNRLQTAHARLAKLQVLPYDIRSKEFLIMGGIYTVGFSGIELVPLGNTHFRALRSEVAQAIHGRSASRNSAIAVACTPHVLDPLVYAIVRCIRSAQRYLLRSLPSDRQVFYDLAATHSGHTHHCHGPASTLSQFLSRIGWTVSRDGLLHTDQPVSFPLMTTSLKTLQVWVEKAWMRDLLTQECSRQATQHMTIDVLSTVQVINQLTPVQQHHMIQEIAGAFQPGSQKCKWATDTDGSCPHCGLPDTRAHRLYECEATEDTRQPYQGLLQHLVAEGSLLHEMPVIFQHPDDIPLQIVSASHVEAQLASEFRDKLTSLVRAGFQPQFFTDGSLLFPQDKVARIAAYSIVLDLCTTDAERIHHAHATAGDALPPTFMLLAAARTTGNQSIFRSELFAVVLVCEWASAAKIITDSAAVIKTFHRCRVAQDARQLTDLSERDLVLRLWHALRGGAFEIQKIKSHMDPATITDPLLRYLCWGNSVADHQANQACTSIMSDYVTTARNLHQDLTSQKAILRKVFDLQLQLQKQRAILQAAIDRQQLAAEVLEHSAGSQLLKLQHWTISIPWERPANDVDMTHHTAWGPCWARAFAAWALEVRWPLPGPSDADDPGVTFQELAMSLCRFAGQVLPFKRANSAGDIFLLQLATQEACEAQELQLAELADMFAVFARQMSNLCTVPFFPDHPKGKCRGLYWLGTRTQSMGYVRRPQFPFQAEVMQTISDMAQAFGETISTRTPFFPFLAQGVTGFLTGQLDQITRELQDPWLFRRHRTQRIATDMRRVRNTDTAGQDIRRYFGGG
eukprot:Skav210367  [mRNA]  locus=scaffold1357:247789:250977:- [translate_table: standard]